MVLPWHKRLELLYIYLQTEQADNVCTAITIALQHGGERRCGTAMSVLDTLLCVLPKDQTGVTASDYGRQHFYNNSFTYFPAGMHHLL